MEIIKKNNPLVSVIVPVFNAEAYVYDTLKSLINQTYSNIEIIVINDGSTDNSLATIHCFIDRFNAKNIYVFSEENRGQGGARNAGVLKANGDWICFVDSDDLIVPNAIEIMIDAAQKNPCDFVFSSFNWLNTLPKLINEEVKSIKMYEKDSLQIDFLTRKTTIIVPGTLYNKSFLVINNLLFENMLWSEDQHFIWRSLCYFSKAVFVNAPLYKYLIRGNSISTSSRYYKIEQSYPFFVKLNELFVNKPLIHKYLLPRWVFGSLNSSALIEKYSKWKKLYKSLCAKKACKDLKGFPDKSIIKYAFIMRFFPRIYYFALRKKRKSFQA